MNIARKDVYWVFGVVVILTAAVLAYGYRQYISFDRSSEQKNLGNSVAKLAVAGVDRGSGPEEFADTLLVEQKKLQFRRRGAWAPTDQTAQALEGYLSFAIPSFEQPLISARMAHVRVLEPKDRSKPLPVVILFHGAGRDSLSILDVFRQAPSSDQFLLLAPESEINGWSLRLSPQTIDAILAHVPADIPIDENRVFVFGHSAGGGLASRLTQVTSHSVRAISVHGGMSKVESDYDGREAYFQEPIRVYSGELEEYFPPKAALAMSKQYAAERHKVELVTIPNHNHWFYTNGPEIAQDALEWFLSLRTIEVAERIDPDLTSTGDNPSLWDVIVERWRNLWS